MLAIKQAFEKKAMTIKKGFETQRTNVVYSPKNGVPYQKFDFVLSKPESLCVDDKNYLLSGFFQITLFYPINKGDGEILKHCELIAKSFSIGDSIGGGFITKPVEIVELGVENDRFVYCASIYFKKGF